MKTRAKYSASLASLMFLLLAGLPGQAASFDVAFYELTERMTFDGVTRTGEGSLAGHAKVGRSPLCPRDVVEALAAAGFALPGHPCYVTATGRDVLSLQTFGGTFEALIEVKVQGDNPVDAPELVVMRASIVGDLVIADQELRLLAIPRGTLTITHVLDPATFTYVEVKAEFPLTGMVRLPFAIEPDGRSRKARRSDAAFYLSDQGQPVRVKRNEHSLGVATARFELSFEGLFGVAPEDTDDE
jgi:hypothetical protein